MSSSTTLPSGNKDSTQIIDNPCWGGTEPNKQNLLYFLQLVDSGYFNVATVTTKIVNPTIIDKALTLSSSSSSSPSSSLPSFKEYNDGKDIVIESLKRNNLIIYDSEEYLVLNKPPDVRMDGAHLTTVHKLVTFLFPPKSILMQMEYDDVNNSNSDDNDNGKTCASKTKTATPSTSLSILSSKYNTKLINIISQISHHGQTKDNIMRNTHQLDYATSGVLLLAKTKQSAALASKAFETRTTKKEYLALVHGCLLHHQQQQEKQQNSNENSNLHDTKNSISCRTIPTLNKNQIEIFHNWMDGTIELKDKKERLERKGGKKKKFTFEGYMPTHTVFGKWKSIRIRRRDDSNTNERLNRKKRKHGNKEEEGVQNTVDDHHDDDEKAIDGNSTTKVILQQKLLQSQNDNEEEMQIWNKNPSNTTTTTSTTSTTAFTSKDEEILLNSTWKDIKKCPTRRKYKIFFDSIAKEINDFYRMKHQRKIQLEKEQYEQEMKDLNKRLPTVFRLDPVATATATTTTTTTTLSDGNDSSNSDNEFYVQIPIAVANDGRFQMVVHPDYITADRLFLPEDVCKQIRSQYSIPKSMVEDLEFKPSLTKCIIQQTGLVWNNNEQVTKVLLQPRTGRR